MFVNPGTMWPVVTMLPDGVTEGLEERKTHLREANPFKAHRLIAYATTVVWSFTKILTYLTLWMNN